MPEYHYRPNECLQILESKYRYVDIEYNQNLENGWKITCKNPDNTMTVSGDNFQEVLNDAVSML